MKKKIILISLFMLCFILTGCSLNNTPKAKVETLLMKYQKNSDFYLVIWYNLVRIGAENMYLPYGSIFV